VTAENAPLRLLLLRWVDDALARIERTVDIPRTRQGRMLRVLAPDPDGDADAPGEAETYQELEHNGVAQVLLLRHATRMERSVARQALCRLAIYGYVLDHAESRSPAVPFAEWVWRDIPAAVPDWLWRGLAGYLDANARADSSEQAATAWREGGLPTLAAFLRAGGNPAFSDAEDSEALKRAYEIMLVNWLITFPRHGELFDRLFAQLASGDALTPEWVCQCLPDCETVTDLGEQWDAWMLVQRRRIPAPGETRESDIQRLEQELVLRRGDPGIPADSDFPESGRFDALLDFRRERWMRGFVAIKTHALRSLALGRGDAYRGVIDAYCEFLDALGRRARSKQLEARLQEAERRYAAFGSVADNAAEGDGNREMGWLDDEAPSP
jgi:hypothetical protein